MDKKEFQEFCKNEFYTRGFQKVKKMYYLDGGKDVLCGIGLQESRYSNGYYVNVDFFFKGFNPSFPYPTDEDADIFKVITVMSKDTYEGEHYRTWLIKYEEYEQSDLKPYFDKEFEEWILPCIYEGTEYIVRSFKKCRAGYPFFIDELRKKAVLKFLNIYKN